MTTENTIPPGYWKNVRGDLVPESRVTDIDKLRDQIQEIGLNVATVNQQESGIAMQMRFQAINAELASFSARMEDLERRAWNLSRKWLGMSSGPSRVCTK